jgi:hypothetical protein
MLNVAAAFQIVRDTDGPERMIAFCRLDARIPRPSAHHVPSIDARHGPLGQLARPADDRVTFQKYQNYFGFRRKNILLGARG